MIARFEGVFAGLAGTPFSFWGGLFLFFLFFWEKKLRNQISELFF